MYVDLSGTVSLITGGGTGIGRALAIGLARCGSSVVVNYSRSHADALDTVATIEQAGGRALALKADVTDEDQVAGLVKQTREHFGGLDILIANSGGPIASQPTAQLSAADWRAGMDLNCSSAFYCVKHSVLGMPDHTGRIIVTTSMSGRTGSIPGMLTYTAAKSAVNNMVRNWAKEYAPRGITVNALSPGIIGTRLHNEPPEEYQKLVDRIPLGRGVAEDMVGPLLMLASREGRYVTGQILEVNGGILMP
jgi:3-oxoacyl-[acyl-carrier protein] reductase